MRRIDAVVAESQEVGPGLRDFADSCDSATILRAHDVRAVSPRRTNRKNAQLLETRGRYRSIPTGSSARTRCARRWTLPDGTKVRTAGRVGQLRKFGKLTFATLEDFDGHIQIALVRDQLDADPEVCRKKYELFSKSVDRWDFLGVEGEMYHTDKGELTIRVHDWTFLGKTLQPPPNKYQGVKDIEDELAQALPRSGLESRRRASAFACARRRSTRCAIS